MYVYVHTYTEISVKRINIYAPINIYAQDFHEHIYFFLQYTFLYVRKIFKSFTYICMNICVLIENEYTYVDTFI
jgi:hypothetical protein